MKQANFSLSHEYTLRKAKLSDLWLIIFFIVKARLDPTQMKLQQFLVIEYHGRLVAFGQLRNFPLAQELGSLYVAPNFRNQGLGTFLIENLIIEATKPLYLKCVKKELMSFYTKRCFVTVDYQDLPNSLKSKFFLSQLRKKFLKGFVFFMKYKA
ncbi:GNAT family N-acetyltransferase [Nostoc sp. FACHB-152]|uniref:GNAT family N-acetyltransferase n=1 Tax=unclassified Nostoc TaxID=2593658 RepID=UPI0016887674|nr:MULTISPECIES: GNAT family N-acetyltransferase [unclassified Nostoc]MBD2452345.1 GNAT family N-acetyltransferase [Nostoc sp. FACHB-152]MBD2473204.1 GNAT family N-acetyltransferase [Nostoc sp. FACHB-145]